MRLHLLAKKRKERKERKERKGKKRKKGNEGMDQKCYGRPSLVESCLAAAAQETAINLSCFLSQLRLPPDVHTLNTSTESEHVFLRS